MTLIHERSLKSGKQRDFPLRVVAIRIGEKSSSKTREAGLSSPEAETTIRRLYSSMPLALRQRQKRGRPGPMSMAADSMVFLPHMTASIDARILNSLSWSRLLPKLDMEPPSERGVDTLGSVWGPLVFPSAVMAMFRAIHGRVLFLLREDIGSGMNQHGITVAEKLVFF